MNEVTVGIISYNRINTVEDYILNNLANKQTRPCKVIICDDGSKDLIDPNKHPIISKYIWNKDTGFNKIARLNEIMNQCDTEYLIYLDDDCIPYNTQFIETYQKHLKEYDVVRGIIDFRNGKDSSAWFSCANIGFKVDKLKEIGGFDMNYNGYYGYSDSDMGKTIEKAGLKILNFPLGTEVRHFGMMYAKGDRSDDILKHNREVYEKKWNESLNFSI